jgi:hypothetical protein
LGWPDKAEIHINQRGLRQGRKTVGDISNRNIPQTDRPARGISGEFVHRLFWRRRADPDSIRPTPDIRSIAEIEAAGYPWIGAACCKGTVWLPFKMLNARIPELSTLTVDQVGARLRCDRCGGRPERYYCARQEGAPGYAQSF